MLKYEFFNELDLQIIEHLFHRDLGYITLAGLQIICNDYEKMGSFLIHLSKTKKENHFFRLRACTDTSISKIIIHTWADSDSDISQIKIKQENFNFLLPLDNFENTVPYFDLPVAGVSKDRTPSGVQIKIRNFGTGIAYFCAPAYVFYMIGKLLQKFASDEDQSSFRFEQSKCGSGVGTPSYEIEFLKK